LPKVRPIFTQELGPTMEWGATAHAVISKKNCSLIKYTKNNIKEKLVYNKENLLNDWFIVESVT